MTSLSERRSEFVSKLALEWNVHPHNLHVPLSGDPLEAWLQPKEVPDKAGKYVLNWGLWLPSYLRVTKQLDRLIGFAGVDSSFFLWKHVESGQGMPSVDCVSVQDPMCRKELLGHILQGQLVNQVMRDERSEEPRRLLCKNVTVVKAKLEEANHVYVLKTPQGEIDGVVLIGSDAMLKASFKTPSFALMQLQSLKERKKVSDIVYIDVFLSNRHSLRGSAKKLLNHAYAQHPESIFVVHCPMIMSTLCFYERNGFTYNDLHKESINILPSVTDRLGSAVRMWNSGFSHLTYSRSFIEDTRVRLSVYHGTLGDALRTTVGVHMILLCVGDDVNVLLNNAIEKKHCVIWLWLPQVSLVDLEPLVVSATNASNTVMAHDWRVDYVALVCSAQQKGDVAQMIMHCPLPETMRCTLDSPVDEDAGDDNDEDRAHPMVCEADDVGCTNPKQANAPSDEAISEYFYNKNRDLRCDRVLALVKLRLKNNHFVEHDNLTIDMRKILAILFSDYDIMTDPDYEGVVVLRDDMTGIDAVAFACIFKTDVGHCRVTHLYCTVEEGISRLFVLMMRTKRPNHFSLETDDSFWSTLLREGIEHLFETTVSPKSRRLFVCDVCDSIAR